MADGSAHPIRQWAPFSIRKSHGRNYRLKHETASGFGWDLKRAIAGRRKRNPCGDNTLSSCMLGTDRVCVQHGPTTTWMRANERFPC